MSDWEVAMEHIEWAVMLPGGEIRPAADEAEARELAGTQGVVLWRRADVLSATWTATR